MILSSCLGSINLPAVISFSLQVKLFFLPEFLPLRSNWNNLHGELLMIAGALDGE